MVLPLLKGVRTLPDYQQTKYIIMKNLRFLCYILGILCPAPYAKQSSQRHLHTGTSVMTWTGNCSDYPYQILARRFIHIQITEIHSFKREKYN